MKQFKSISNDEVRKFIRKTIKEIINSDIVYLQVMRDDPEAMDGMIPEPILNTKTIIFKIRPSQ